MCLYDMRYGRRSFYCMGPSLFNALPKNIRLTVNINAFKARLKTHYFKRCYNYALNLSQLHCWYTMYVMYSLYFFYPILTVFKTTTSCINFT